MDQSEYAALMLYLQQQMRRAEMGELVDRIVADAGPDAGPPSRQLLRMLDVMEDEFRRQDAGTSERIMGQFAETVRTVHGEAPGGLWLDLAPAHRNLFATDAVDLMRGPRLGAVLEQIDALRRHMEDDMGRPQRR